MSVVSYIFIVFLAFTVLIYYIVPKKIQWWVLLAASVVFYAYSGIDDLLIVVGTAFLVYPLTMVDGEKSGGTGPAASGCR